MTLKAYFALLIAAALALTHVWVWDAGRDSLREEINLQNLKDTNKRTNEILEFERNQTKRYNEVARTFEVRKNEIQQQLDDALRDAGAFRLRLKSCNSRLSKAGSSSGKSDDSAENGTDGTGASEIDLAGVAQKIIDLGSQLDAANAKIEALQSALKVYQNGE